tara:strand:+ start:129 stop:869 length:741 start_codon:yes stop_codon:yes gene_type:complete
MHQQIVKYLNLGCGLTIIFLFGFISFSYLNPNILTMFAQIRNINVDGVEFSDLQKIREISQKKGRSLFTFNSEDAAKEIKTLSWVKKVNIKKNFPNTLSVVVIENDPFAYLLKNQKIYLIDIDGELIVEKDENAIIEDQRLIVSGFESELNLSNLISNLNIHYPDILSSVKEMEFIERRRWNLILNNKLIIKLPESNIGKSLEDLKKLIEKYKIFKNNIIEVDLRINDRAIIKIYGDKLKVDIEEA